MKDNLGFIVFTASVVIVLAVAIRKNLFQDINDMAQTLKIGKHNIEYQFSPDRRIPFVITDKEFSLKNLYPGFFNNFGRDEWLEFWDIIYGIHPLIDFKNEKLPSAQRNYYISEIEEALIKRYPEVFSAFSEEHWKMFWKEIFGIIDYKFQSSPDEAIAQRQKDKSDRKLYMKMQKDDEKISDTIEGVKGEIKD